MPPKDITSEQEIEFYSAQVNAWFTTRFEKDRSLLTLSTAGIGVLLTLQTKINDYITLSFYLLALTAFSICLFSVLWIFQQNSTHLENGVQGKSAPDKCLTLLDRIAMWSFLVGVLCAVLIGVLTAVHSLNSYQEIHMTEQKKLGGSTSAMDSINGFAKMRPAQLEKRTPSTKETPSPPQKTSPAPTPKPTK